MLKKLYSLLLIISSSLFSCEIVLDDYALLHDSNKETILKTLAAITIQSLGTDNNSFDVVFPVVDKKTDPSSLIQFSIGHHIVLCNTGKTIKELVDSRGAPVVGVDALKKVLQEFNSHATFKNQSPETNFSQIAQKGRNLTSISKQLYYQLAASMSILSSQTKTVREEVDKYLLENGRYDFASSIATVLTDMLNNPITDDLLNSRLKKLKTDMGLEDQSVDIGTILAKVDAFTSSRDPLK